MSYFLGWKNVPFCSLKTNILWFQWLLIQMGLIANKQILILVHPLLPPDLGPFVWHNIIVERKTVLDPQGACNGTLRQPTLSRSNFIAIFIISSYDKTPFKNHYKFYLFSFAFPTAITSSSTTITTTTTHLNNQNYNICIRRASGYCYICYSTVATTDPQSFGLSYVSYHF